MGEIAGQFGGCKRSLLLVHGGRVLPLPLIAEEPEEPVFAADHLRDRQWPACSYAELVSDQSGNRRVLARRRLVEKVVGVQVLVAQIVICRAMDVVCA